MKLIIIASFNLRKFDGVGNSCIYQYNYLKNKLNKNHKVLLASESTDYKFLLNYSEVAKLSFKFETTVIYHHSIYDPFLGYLLCGKFKRFSIYFHGITPPELLDHKVTSFQCLKGIEQISSFQFLNCNYLISNSLSSINQILNLPFKTKKLIIPPLLKSNFHDFNNASLLERKLDREIIKGYFTGRVTSSHKNVLEGLSNLFNICKRNSIKFEFHIFTSSSIDEVNYFLSDKIARNVIIHSRLSDKDIFDISSNLDFYYSPSNHEGFCIPLYDALLRGIPVLAKDLECFNSYYLPIHLKLYKNEESFDVAFNNLISLIRTKNRARDTIFSESLKLNNSLINASNKLIKVMDN